MSSLQIQLYPPAFSVNNCVECGSIAEFSWSCNHKYCMKCAANIVNKSLSIHNTIPKCNYSDCNQLLSNRQGHKLISLLSPKYQDIGNLTSTYLVYGYVREHDQRTSKDIILCILDYYNLTYFTKINCNTQISDGDKHIVLDFSKLTQKQSLCYKCNQYFPNNMIIYWSNNCSHTYCYQCIAPFIKNELKWFRTPMCLVSTCIEPLTTNNLKLINMNKYLVRELSKLVDCFICQYCNTIMFIDNLFLWSNCNHKYCLKCATTILNQSLSLFNKIPVCSQWITNSSSTTKCEQPLDQRSTAKLQRVLLRRYRITSRDISYYKEYCLLTGYMRDIVNYVPSQLLWIIFDFYDLIFHTTSTCISCPTNCDDCQGFGYVEYPTFKSIYKCRGSGYDRAKCRYCDGTGKSSNSCNVCDGRKKVMIIKLNKLLKHQSLCIKCNTYFPNNQIILWSTCQHRYCDECISSHIAEELKNRIPICLESKCDEELMSLDSELIEEFLSSPKMSDNVAMNEYQKLQQQKAWSLMMLTKFQTLQDRKYRFTCSYCNERHDVNTLFIWSQCKHEYGKKCAQIYVGDQLNKYRSIVDGLVNIEKEYPKCCRNDCDVELDINEAPTLTVVQSQSFGILNHLINFFLFG